ncbi:hypothetical protein [Cellvibrio sp. PSBB006]|uniref:hypothetical protein n=1 Tax=Cellvibrio sp. PSBB006 TaxID=1987723 RepID=UPI000B3B768B|nr:hypothetical protein [Cellvibrio sp. PSBB006]ARU28663.1 hypothetical protein CBR65_15090 [Cellvibrio sp. PSBB006]
MVVFLQVHLLLLLCSQILVICCFVRCSCFGAALTDSRPYDLYDHADGPKYGPICNRFQAKFIFTSAEQWPFRDTEPDVQVQKASLILQGLLTFRGDGTRTNTGFGSFEQRQLDGKEMVAEMNTVSEISEFK